MNGGTMIEAFDFESGQSVGIFNSVLEASRKLFIKKHQTIYFHLVGSKGRTFKGKQKGVTSYKNGKKYTFKAI